MAGAPLPMEPPMLHVIDRHSAAAKSEILEACWRFRHRIFVEERGWHALARPDGREIDQFDDEHAVHVVLTRSGRVAAYARLLPTTRPHILSDVHPFLVGPAPAPRGAHVWEWNRQAVAPEWRGGRGHGSVEAELIQGLVEHALDEGVCELVGEGPVAWLPWLLGLGWEVVPLGLPKKIDGQRIVAMRAPIDEILLLRIRAMTGLTRALPEPAAVPRPAVALRA